MMAAKPEADLNDTQSSETNQAAQKNDIEASAAVVKETATPDPYEVNWDGPEDAQNPFNWSIYKKSSLFVCMALNTFLTALSSSMFAPAVADVLAQFHSNKSILGSFVVSIFLLGYMFGPLIIAPMSELYGRVPSFHVCNVLFLVFTIACAVAQTLPQLFVFRFLAGVAGSCPMTIGNGTTADMIPREKRAGIMTIWAMGPILGPVIGPIAGGFVAESIGWRWIFWIIAIAYGVMIILTTLCYRETYAPVLLERKAAQLRRQTGDQRYRSTFNRGSITAHIFWMALKRPIKLLFLSPIVFLMALFSAMTYGYLYLMFTTISEIFIENYGFTQGSSGLAYIGLGIGAIIGLRACGMAADRIAEDHTARGCFTPESRLIPMIFGCWLLPIGLFWYGWSVQAGAHWIIPILGTGVFGIGLMTVFSTVNFYLVDSYLIYSASATAANAVMRSFIGSVIPLAGPSMYSALGVGWGNSLLAFVALVLCCVPLLFQKYGERIRTNPRFQLEL